jgi:hypothetical protein
LPRCVFFITNAAESRGIRFLVAGLLFVAAAMAAPAEELFQSAPGPEAPKPKQRPPAPTPTPAAPAPVAIDFTVQRRAPSGVAAMLRREWSVDANCAARPIDITIAAQPRNGTATIRDDTMTIPAKPDFGSVPAACVGRPVASKSIYYQSNAGFRGPDTLGFLVNYDGKDWKRIDVQINVE